MKITAVESPLVDRYRYVQVHADAGARRARAESLTSASGERRACTATAR